MQSEKWVVEVIDDTACVLGESAFWDDKGGRFLWLDILSKSLFEKSKSGEVHRHDFGFTPSAILRSELKGCVQLVTNIGIVSYDLDRRMEDVTRAIDFPTNYRTNDAAIDPEGRIVFGAMQWKPTGENGSIFRLEKSGELTKIRDHIGIPNTFVWSVCGRKLYYADSFLRKMFVANYSSGGIEQEGILFELSEPLTPDGSCVHDDKMFNAVWGGAYISVRDFDSGCEIEKIHVPAMQPTSCVWGGDNMESLLITSAYVDMDESQMTKFPLSGKTFLATIR